mmetsp:Transcript_9/g.15  ORF Transcript_9/g.15 Transcript_9/m.15 type:complete len:165 (+) Transcript_9:142-636(+)
MPTFKPGPVFESFGAHAEVPDASELPANVRFAVAFDVAVAADRGTINRYMESAARFINMHVAAGVSRSDIRVAVVVHGKAALDLLRDEVKASREEAQDSEALANPTGAMIAEMIENEVRFILCGQTGASLGIVQEDMIEGVETALSAMTAHALLQQDGYTLNPF